MSERGVFAVDRGIWEHTAFADEPLTEREAFLWLISEAAWKPRAKRTDGRLVQLDRGQLCHAVRFMAGAWGWSKSRVDRFLDRLENQDMIARDHGTRTPAITICNYDAFQRVSLPERDNSGTTSGTRVGQERDKLEDIKNIKSLSCAISNEEEGEGRTPVPIRKPQKARDEHETFPTWWAEYPKREGTNPRKPAAQRYTAAINAGADPVAMLAGLRAYRAELQKTGKLGSSYVKQALNWLGQECWKDYAGAAPSGLPIVMPTAEPTARLYLARFFNEGFWSPGWGPKPGQPDCRIAASLIQAVAGELGRAMPNIGTPSQSAQREPAFSPRPSERVVS